MDGRNISLIAKEMGIKEWQVENTLKLFDMQATIPFISRYRKEMTGELDEIKIQSVRELSLRYDELEKRRRTIVQTIESAGCLTDELRNALESSMSVQELEDFYLPYKPKKKTRALAAKEKGLEPLARIIFDQSRQDIYQAARSFAGSPEEALSGARDIIAEWISEDRTARNSIRNIFTQESVITSQRTKKESEHAYKYTDYFAFSEPLKRCAAHRLLALFRGEEEEVLRLAVGIDDEKALTVLTKMFVRSSGQPAEQMKLVIGDAWKRLLAPSFENEFRSLYKEKADKTSIGVFAENLKQLLMSPPLGRKRVMAIDPGFRTGCKIVCLDEQGNPVHTETIYPHPPKNETALAAKKVNTLVLSCRIEAIAIGNGTAGRETESFIKRIRFDKPVQVFVVSEAGASVYSASKNARDEFPGYDVTVRGAISIGRRLMDPLAELVKIDPKSIGIGQYQHDVNQAMLKEALDQVVENCVNAVGVDVNTASEQLLAYVSGLGPILSRNIISFRNTNGPFRTRGELMNIPRMGPRAFEQSAGFLRIRNGLHPLDNSAVHPESYYIVEKMAQKLGCQFTDLMGDPALRNQLKPEQFSDDKTGIPTVADIISELAKPGRDPRPAIRVLEFSESVRTIEDVKPGMVLPGIVTNLTNFGAFVDIGVKQDGLVHVSQMADRFITSPTEVVSLHQHVQVKVIEVDIQRKRIQLSLQVS